MTWGEVGAGRAPTIEKRGRSDVFPGGAPKKRGRSTIYGLKVRGYQKEGGIGGGGWGGGALEKAGIVDSKSKQKEGGGNP